MPLNDEAHFECIQFAYVGTISGYNGITKERMVCFFWKVAGEGVFNSITLEEAKQLHRELGSVIDKEMTRPDPSRN
jgi:hypothetical protein